MINKTKEVKVVMLGDSGKQIYRNINNKNNNKNIIINNKKVLVKVVYLPDT